jgi:hypothetical protein
MTPRSDSSKRELVDLHDVMDIPSPCVLIPADLGFVTAAASQRVYDIIGRIGLTYQLRWPGN